MQQVGPLGALLFLKKDVKNLTPDKLPKDQVEILLHECDQALREAVDILKPQLVVGVGGWAFKRAQVALRDTGVKTGTILHPSPASPEANKGWAQRAETQLQALGVEI